ncbi:hypothetical protein L2778_001298 [Vibrio vulnificus]|nr:hypothetical protein [Vibrio vulnificus]EIZ1360386.1 hypothetical protein [Vibrio vulnificus]
MAKIHTKATFTLPAVISTNVVLYSHHPTRRHSRAHGNPFIHTRQMPRLETHCHNQQLHESKTDNTGNEAEIPNHTTRYTMDPRVREDDELRERNSSASEIKKELGSLISLAL